MKIMEMLRFSAGATLISPLLAAEDVLRYFGAPISVHGITKDENGDGILKIWKECGPSEKAVETKKPFKKSYHQDFRVSVKADIEEVATGGDGPASSENARW
jgi:hypothetical protein